jgi:TolB-like protein/DNA-binding winged helix-turn-helix (wHTH) protein/Tfp pilus assembly protein PilF
LGVPFRVARFAEFELDSGRYELRRGDRVLKLEKIPMELLILLAESNGQLVTRDQIIERIWGKDVFLDTEHGINTAIRKIRQVLSDDPERPRFVQTVTGKGYRFIAPATEVGESAPGPALVSAPLAVDAPNVIGSRHRWKNTRSPRFSMVAVAGTLALVFALIAYFGWRRTRAVPSSHAGPVVLAVLPFQNLSGDDSQDYFSDGLTEEMITQLGELNVDQLGVIARTSSMKYKDTIKDVSQIGRELGADYVLESSVRRDGERMRITVQLIRVENQRHIWANSYDRDVTHSIAVQEEVAREVALQIQLRLTDAPASHPSAPRPLNPAANEAYLKGRYFFNQFTEDGFSKAASYFDQAIAADPNFAAAYSGLSHAYIFLIIMDAIAPSDGYPKARDAAQRAVALDSGLADGRLALAHFKMHMWQWKDSDLEFKKAIALNPSSAPAHRLYAAYLAAVGKQQEALDEMRQARRLDPLSMVYHAEMTRTLYYGRQYEQAVEWARQAEQLDSEFARTHFWLGRVYAQMGKYSEAITEAGRSSPSPESTLSLTEMAHATAKAGKSDEARALLRKLEERSKRGYVPAYDFAVVYVALGEKEVALQWLQKAYEEHDWALIVVAVEPRLDPLRSDPRFQELVRKVGLQP